MEAKMALATKIKMLNEERRAQSQRNPSFSECKPQKQQKFERMNEEWNLEEQNQMDEENLPDMIERIECNDEQNDQLQFQSERQILSQNQQQILFQNQQQIQSQQQQNQHFIASRQQSKQSSNCKSKSNRNLSKQIYDEEEQQKNQKENNPIQDDASDHLGNQHNSKSSVSELDFEDDEEGEQKEGQSTPTPKQIKEIKHYAQNLERFKKLREQKYSNGKINLGVLYIQELVYYCYKQELIIKDLMLSIRFFSLISTLNFIKFFKEDNLCDFDFNTQKFTLHDHRRLTQMLVDKNPSKYTIHHSFIYNLPFEAYSFLNFIYQMPQQEYDKVCENLDDRYDMLWWKSILTGGNGFYVEPEKVFEDKADKAEVKMEQGKRKVIKKKENAKSKKIEEQENYPIPIEQSEFSSSIFDSHIVAESQDFSMQKQSHSISDLSDLFSQSDNQEKGKKNKRNGRKQKPENKEVAKKKSGKKKKKSQIFSSSDSNQSQQISSI